MIKSKNKSKTKKRTKNKTKMKRRAKKIKFAILGITVFFVLILLSLAAFFYIDKLNKINYIKDSTITVDTTARYDDESNEFDFKNEISNLSENKYEIDYINADTSEFNATNDLPKAESIVLKQGDIFTNKDIINVLFLGTDERTTNFSDNARADSIMLFSLNYKTKGVKLVSIQRGVGVPIEGRRDDWLTHTFRYGGAPLTVKTVEDCFGIHITGYVRVNFAAFQRMVDAVNGVDIEISDIEAMGLNGEVYTNATTRNKVYTGMNHLDGYDALQYARLRFIDSDWNRIVRQRNIIKSLSIKVRNMDLLELNSLVDTELSFMQTNLSKLEITSLLFHVPDFLKSEIQDISLPAEGTYYGAVTEWGQVLNIVDFEINREILHSFLEK